MLCTRKLLLIGRQGAKTRSNLLAVQIVGEHCGQQEISLSDLLSVPLLCEYKEAHLVFPQLYHHLMQQRAHFLRRKL
jgi:hypothetical protein